MGDGIDYNSLKDRLDRLTKKTDTSYKRLIKARRNKGGITTEEKEMFSPADHSNEKYSKFVTRRSYDSAITSKLVAFNDYLLKGNFKYAGNSIRELKEDISQRGMKSYYSPEEKEKLVYGINKRIERGMNYLEKNPEEKNLIHMKEILSTSKSIEDNLLEKKESSSGLEKAVTAISLLSVILGVAIGYPALTGNVIAETIPGSLKHGALLFLIGLVGIFLANKK